MLCEQDDRKCLGKCVGNVVLCWTVLQCDYIIRQAITDVVKFDINVLRALVEYRVPRETY